MSQNGSTRTIAVTSGKGGVGKTNFSVNLALQLAELGKKVCILDADLGLANISILLGLDPEYDLEDVISKGRRLEDIIIRDFHGIDVIPGSSGVERIAHLGDGEVKRLIGAFSDLKTYEFLLIDTSAGVNKSILAFCLASSDIVLIITPEPTSLTDAYALLKILARNGYRGTARIVVNQCGSPKSAFGIYQKFKETVRKYLSIDLILLGVIVKDPRVEEAVRRQEAFLLFAPDSNASRCMRHLTERLLDHVHADLDACGIEPFWSRCLELIQGPVRMSPDQDGCKPSDRDSQEETADMGPSTAERMPPAQGRASPPQPEEGDSTPEVAPSQQAYFTLLDRLIKEVSSVSRELSFLRETLEKNTGTRPFDSGFPGDQKRQGIFLDFDAFIKVHSSQNGAMK